MPSPFPGMDPWMEQQWGDAHHTLITFAREQIRPLLPPDLRARVDEREFVDSYGGPNRPIYHEPMTQGFIQIVDARSGNRVITAIEVLSPDNKSGGAGRTSYLNKREELWNNGANLIEIDLLREGQSTVWLTAEQRDNVRPWHYLVAVSRRSPARGKTKCSGSATAAS